MKRCGVTHILFDITQSVNYFIYVYFEHSRTTNLTLDSVTFQSEHSTQRRCKEEKKSTMLFFLLTGEAL
jgi:hypothetical protein